MDDKWDSEENFENSLFAFSEMEGGRCNKDEVTVPREIAEFNARVGVNHRSVFDMPESDNVTIVVSGRGRGGVSTIIRPGEVPLSNANAADDIRRRIREVAGPGFSNELIEQDVKAKTAGALGMATTEVKLQPTSFSRADFASRSTPNNTSGVGSPYNTSRIHTPLSSSKSSPAITPKKSPSVKSNMSYSSRGSTPPSVKSNMSNSSRGSTPPDVVETQPLEQEETPAKNPPPLSVILNLGKKTKKQVHEAPKVTMEQNGIEKKQEASSAIKENIHVTENMNEYWWRDTPNSNSNDSPISWRRRDNSSPNRFFSNHWNQKRSPRSFNINSSEEFPALK